MLYPPDKPGATFPHPFPHTHSLPDGALFHQRQYRSHMRSLLHNRVFLPVSAAVAHITQADTRCNR